MSALGDLSLILAGSKADTAEALSELDGSISKLASELERMAPNMKAIERYGQLGTHSKRLY